MRFFGRNRHRQTAPGQKPAIRIHPLTVAHVAVLAQIESPWMEAALSNQPDKEAALREALRQVTQSQLAEFMFVMSRPAGESKALLERGRGELSKAAMAFALEHVSEQELKTITQNAGTLICQQLPAQQTR